jgi:hypothetical protein
MSHARRCLLAVGKPSLGMWRKLCIEGMAPRKGHGSRDDVWKPLQYCYFVWNDSLGLD